jgi:hypothetical protein
MRASIAIVLGVCLPASLPAMKFSSFDRMGIEAQAEFTAVIIYETQKALRSEGHADAAMRIEDLFTARPPGDRIAAGLLELEGNEVSARDFDAQQAAKNPKARRMDVEEAFFLTLQHHDIVVSKGTGNALIAKLANFHLETCAEFEASSPAEQRRLVAALAKIGWPELRVRQLTQALLKGDKNSKLDLMPAILAAQFPAKSTEQPGFAGVAAMVRAAAAKTPGAPGPFHELETYILNTAAAPTSRNAPVASPAAPLVSAPSGNAVMIGKVDVTHFAGLRPGDTRERVDGLFGPSTAERPWALLYGPTLDLAVEYAGNLVKGVTVYSGGTDWVRSRAGADALLQLIGVSESAAIALLGPPQNRHRSDDDDFLEWYFRMPGRPDPVVTPADQLTNESRSGLKLELKFKKGATCTLVGLDW